MRKRENLSQRFRSSSWIKIKKKNDKQKKGKTSSFLAPDISRVERQLEWITSIETVLYLNPINGSIRVTLFPLPTPARIVAIPLCIYDKVRSIRPRRFFWMLVLRPVFVAIKRAYLIKLGQNWWLGIIAFMECALSSIIEYVRVNLLQPGKRILPLCLGFPPNTHLLLFFLLLFYAFFSVRIRSNVSEDRWTERINHAFVYLTA